MIELGTGQLSWHGSERRSDRYGTVALWDDATPGGNGEQLTWPQEALAAAGKTGYLIAHIIETRQSDHIGDLFRGFKPVTPEVDEVIEMGPGVLFFEQIDDLVCAGLRPDDGRTDDWLDPHDLYRLHQQTVRLEFAAEDDQ